MSDNPSELRYELRVDGGLAGQIRYRRGPDAMVLVHTDVDPHLEGHGLGNRLVQDALDDLRARGHTVVPICPFVAGFIRSHPEYADLVTTDTAHSRYSREVWAIGDCTGDSSAQSGRVSETRAAIESSSVRTVVRRHRAEHTRGRQAPPGVACSSTGCS